MEHSGSGGFCSYYFSTTTSAAQAMLKEEPKGHSQSKVEHYAALLPAHCSATFHIASEHGLRPESSVICCTRSRFLCSFIVQEEQNG